ncbi:MAG: hypothetical protein K2Q24_16475 [Chitinophagaceae bacterium]|jgi:hypothetical protein|nr:hypothetical protein [Chitinophagaceae bacterium]
MKKLIAAILSFLYISTSSGATLQMHYCMDQLVNWSIGDNDEKNTCTNCGMEKNGQGKNDCCKDEQKQLKIEKDQKSAQSIQIALSLAVAVPVSYLPTSIHDYSSITEAYPINNAPPRTADCPDYIRNCTFRI